MDAETGSHGSDDDDDDDNKKNKNNNYDDVSVSSWRTSSSGNSNSKRKEVGGGGGGRREKGLEASGATVIEREGFPSRKSNKSSRDQSPNWVVCVYEGT